MKRKSLSELTQLDRIERNSLLAAKNVLTIEDASLLLGIVPRTLYKWTMNKIVPHYKPNGKIVYFDRKELEDWMRRNRVASEEEIQDRAANY